MSNGGMPELGSKISLISKADIRYEGRLYTVDPQECTIALANVRSFGTEDRETQYPIAPQSQIYDYILFRGTDIKDIRVVNDGLPHPNDPAIMQMQLPNGQHLMPHFPIPAMNPSISNFSNPFGGLSNMSSLAPGSSVPALSNNNTAGNLATGSLMLNKSKQQNLLIGGSRSTTPVSLVSRKSPSADMGVQVNSQPTSHQQIQNNQVGNNNRDAGHKRQNQQHNNRNQQHNNFRRDSGRVDQQYHDNRNNYNSQRNQYQNHRGNNNWMNNRGGGMKNNMMMQNRGRGRMQNRNYFGGYRQPIGNGNKNRQSKTIKFDQDFDFEQANNKFEELRSQLGKLKMGDAEAKPTIEQVNGETDTKRDDSGNETGAGEHEQDEEFVGYDKAKSFFDNISCEAADKTKKRNDWRQERKLNSETFGVLSTKRGSYRGRGGGPGGYYNRNISNGAFNRGYRPNNYNNRGRSNNMNNNNRNGQNLGILPKTHNLSSLSPSQKQTSEAATSANTGTK